MEGIAFVVGAMLLIHFVFEVLPTKVGLLVFLAFILVGGAVVLYGFGLAFLKADLVSKALAGAVVTAIWILAGRPGLGIFKKKIAGGSRDEHV